MFFMIKNITFSSVDKQLKDAKNEFSEINENLQKYKKNNKN